MTYLTTKQLVCQHCRMKNKSLVTTALIAAALIVVIGIWINVTRQPEDTIKIGGAYNLTGATAVMGELQLNGSTLAIEEINRNGGINGKKVELVTEDTASSATQALNAYQALTFKGVRYVVAETSAVVGAIRQTVVDDGNLILTPGSVTSSYYDNNQLSCRLALTARSFGSGFSALFNELGYKRVITLLPDNEYGRSVAEEFKKTYASTGGQVVFAEFYPASADAGDYRTNLAKVKSQQAGADVILYVQTTNPVEVMLKQFKEVGLTIPVVSDIYTINNSGLKDRSLANGIRYVDYEYVAAPSETDSAVTKDFKSKYKARYGADPVYLAAAHYDAIILLAEAIDNVGDNPQLVAKYISALKSYDAITGALSFDADCEVDRSMVFREVVEGKIRNLTI